jgi:hypothetical protein
MYILAVLSFRLAVLIFAPTLFIAWLIAAVVGYLFLKAIGG